MLGCLLTDYIKVPTGDSLQQKDKNVFGQTVTLLPVQSLAKKPAKHKSKRPASPINSDYFTPLVGEHKCFFWIHRKALRDLLSVIRPHPCAERQQVPTCGWLQQIQQDGHISQNWTGPRSYQGAGTMQRGVWENSEDEEGQCYLL